MEINEILAMNIFGNTVSDYAMATGIFLLTSIIIFIIKTIILIQIKRIAKRTKIKIDDKAIEYIESINFLFYFILSIYVSTSFLVLPEILRSIIYYSLLVTIAYYVIKLIQKFIDYVFGKIEDERKKKEYEEDFSHLRLLRDMIKTMIWFLAILLLLSNFGFDVTALIAGLGIGGIAIAFALQSILADVFASFSIYFDKPFRKGDFIVVGNESGTIKKIGLKTTRLESPLGEEIVISNRMLVDSNIHNYKKMNYRRPVFSISVENTTPAEKLEKIPGYIREIIEGIERNGNKITKVERIHFKSFSESALVYEIMYTINSNDYNVYMDVQQEINIGIIKKFKKEKIRIAYPTRIIYLKKE